MKKEIHKTQTTLTVVQETPRQATRAVVFISTFQVAESIGFKGDFRAWEHLLRIGD
jgi:hypothetical protein